VTTTNTDGAVGPAAIAAGGYPKQAELRGGRTVDLRLMEQRDGALLHDFFRDIPSEDLLFLRRNVTDRPVIDQWAERVGRGSVVTVFALEGGKVVGEASLHLSSTPWSEHVGEVRVVVDAAHRQTGLGTRLTNEIFLLAVQRGIEKIVAEMTIEQKGAIAVFQKLGFRVEGLLRNHVRDQAGEKHDLVLMGHETQEFYDQMRAYGYTDELGVPD
jgi:RimJ/RimL family protein N-acetyltransferase